MELLNFDQLLIEKKDRKVFLQFEEEEITFAPTYRFERHTRENYVYTKQKATGMKYNLPSWCDRVLWKSYPLVHVVCQSYGCATDIMTSDHSPVFATFEVAVTSQFVSKNDNKCTDSSGQIEFLHCSAKLKTKSQTKFYIEFHSSCLESFVKSKEGENEEGNEGELVVTFVEALPKLTPIISDPEYLLDQHILISIKSSDSDESYGEGCIALRSGATESQVPIQTILTHHGEITGIFQGEFKLQTSQGKQREKLYDFVKIERDETSGQKSVKGCVDCITEWEQTNRAALSNRKSTHLVAKEAAAIARFRGTPAVSLDEPCKEELVRSTAVTDINNPSYVRVPSASQSFPATGQLKQIPSPDQVPAFWSYDPQSKDSSSLMSLESPTTPSSLSPGSPRAPTQTTTKRKDQLYSEVRKSMTEPLLLEEAFSKPEMIDNPLYDFGKSKEKLQSKREQEFFKAIRKELPVLPEQSFPFTNLQEGDATKSSIKQQSSLPFPAPAPRFRSYTCSNQSEEKTALIEKTQNRQRPCASVEPGVPAFKKPVKFSRSEVGQSKPPLPSKSQLVLDMQNIKGRDYRESSELPHNRKHQSEDVAISRTIVP